MRKINKIIIHCTATPEGREVTIKDLQRWHIEERGWSDIGYHYFIDLKGVVYPCRPLAKIGSHTKGENKFSIGIAYAGGMDKAMRVSKDTRTPEQKEALDCLLHELKDRFQDAMIYGHRDFSTKDCPSFDAFHEYFHISQNYLS